jgi:hypothetical protein
VDGVAGIAAGLLLRGAARCRRARGEDEWNGYKDADCGSCAGGKAATDGALTIGRPVDSDYRPKE